MDVKDKIDILLAEIRELALLNPQSPSFQLGLDISSGYYSDESRLYMEYAEDLITIDDKVSILNKFEADGLIKGLEFDKQMAYFAINDLDVESDSNPYQDSKSGAVILRIKPDKTDLDRGILVLSTGENIYISGQAGNENNPLRLLKTLNKDTSKEWAEDEILEDWEGIVASNVEVPKDRVYQASKNLQRKVELQTGITDLVLYRNKTYRLNSKYL